MNTEILKATRDNLSGGSVDVAKADECQLWAVRRKSTLICLPDDQIIRSTEDETLLYLPIALEDVPAIAALVVDLWKKREAGRVAEARG